MKSRRTPFSTTDWLVQLSATGQVEVRADLRSKVDRGFFFLHPFKELVSFDSKRRTLLTPYFRAEDQTGARFTLVLDVDSGDAQVREWAGALQNQFYDRVVDETIVYNCATPGFERFDDFMPEPSFTPLFSIDLNDPDAPPGDRCRQGFLGAAFDPARRTHFILFHNQADFFIAVSNLALGRFVGLFPAGVTAATFHFAAPVLPPVTFFSTQYVPQSP
jgi:hypothetical protein